MVGSATPGRPLEKVEAPITTDEPFLWVLAGLLMHGTQTYTAQREDDGGRVFLYPNSKPGALPSSTAAVISECPDFSYSCRFAWQRKFSSFQSRRCLCPSLRPRRALSRTAMTWRLRAERPGQAPISRAALTAAHLGLGRPPLCAVAA